MRKLAENLYRLRGVLPYVVNVYLIGDVLVDAGTRFDRWRILHQLRGRKVQAHALTHAHPDHQGSSHAVCDALGIPLWCGEADAEAVETAGLMMARLPGHWVSRTFGPLVGGPPHPVARRLREGDEVGGFTVLETPGHCAGHLSFWRGSDRVLVLGDILSNINFKTGRPGLREPPEFFSPNPAQNRESARKVAALNPALICFGHGPPLRNAQEFVRFVQALPE